MSGTERQIGVRVTTLASGEEAAWDRFVMACPEATFFHRVGWKRVIEEAFGHRSHFLLARRGVEICGVLPLVQVRTLLFGHSLVSLPFCVYGGVAASDEESRLALEGHAEALAVTLGVDWLECRNCVPRRSEWSSKELYYTFRKSFDPDPAVNLAAIPRKQRAEVRRGVQHGLVGVRAEGIQGRCFDIYAESVRNLGTPIFSRRLFVLLQEEFADDCEGLVIERGGRAVAAVVSFYFRDQVLPYYGGGRPEARGCGAMAFMYWELMRLAAERGASLFDFGRSKKGSGSFDFKRYYGFDPEPLHYRYRLVGGTALPEVNPMNPKYRLLIAAWKHLPLFVAGKVGPWLARGLG
ncbi:MAG: FemAB family PEP-CTERM system-associated protein [Magnetococcales bacterium]|nr:FemAB family PEP-CTERM system-associated protein [Magnetococcales bacterium]NGZ05413.1 FemAB family PEP-CTERM system-associated protein [Magnetococcales bacterium]